MNKDQRKFLISWVEKTFNAQKEGLKEPVPPSINNYIVAAILDNSIEYVDIKTLRQAIKKMVLQLGSGDVLVKEDRYYRGRSRVRLEEDSKTISIDAENIFILPKGYVEARKEYERKREEYDRAILQLEQFRDTIIMKVQIGSDQVLDKLIGQADNLADLNIINNQLMIEKTPLKITRGV